MNTIKRYYEVFLLIIVTLAFFLFRKEALGVNTYMIVGGIIGLYFTPVKIIATVISIETKQTGVNIMSSLIIAAIIGTSLIAVNNKHFPGLSTVAYALAVINIVFMIYTFFKDQERKLFLLHFVMVMLISVLLELL
ncbi:hypothetical protein E0W68_12555 [Flavobacterium salilacus subsp. salilacus]|uniref:hypothetical protein n=1 Tax=Flavobacterium TaxID=237 RepID=UPI001075780B|nr:MULTISPECIES: hypothetical protein [Flavobacterium]KAF2515779.1 hypothetical protein E0W68_12555 [Flavobacterium salilacus subsp. salilacus]MBE1615420.1 hypothetical protein [Flavobacterium sp. SaA2.13]